MNAIIQTGYGSTDVLRPGEVRQPVPADGEVLVRVVAASLGAGDCYLMHGRPFPARLMVGFPRPRKDHVVGLDCAGVVEAVGPNVDGFRAGDEVFGECRGSCAEYAVASAARLAHRPHGVTFEQAAAVPTSGCTALQALRDHGEVRPGQKVLINGASGGVGTFAVQIAKSLGADVTAVCSPGSAELVCSLGADHIIDYTREDFTQGGPRYDVILDNVASHSPSAARRALAPGGVHVPSSGHAGMGWIVRAAIASLFVREQGRPFEAFATTDDLVELGRLIEAGQVRPVVDRVYPFSETAAAFGYLDQGHARGKVIISVGSDHA